MSAQAEPLAAQRCQRTASVSGVEPLHEPGVAVRRGPGGPTAGTVGAVVFAGALSAVSIVRWAAVLSAPALLRARKATVRSASDGPVLVLR